ncbi:hypothetical protein [Lentzea flava]|uniref:Uncharacterized protein n=1 Tax=Lentzea flava TaxID=103732 RepID=A0ABQ2UZX2_9PSEU|nr:hypothetical protein [Lentzea flava]MCP2202731.1 hypothetical protein [Lentzea flava]GGU61586.1 hypothetical protein GCM10010178_62190 [Lentzea flava]
MANLASTITRADTAAVVYGPYGGPQPTPAEADVRLECLQGCDDAHNRGRGNECHVEHVIGTTNASYDDAELTVRSYSTTEGALRFAEVGFRFDGDHPDCERFLNPDVARKLARLLLEAANVAERVAAGGTR